MRMIKLERADGSVRWMNADAIVEVAILKDGKRARIEFANNAIITVSVEDLKNWGIECKNGSSTISYPE